MTLLAIAAGGLVMKFLFLLAVVVVFALLYWLAHWIVATWALPEVVIKVIDTVLVFAVVIVLIDFVMSIFGAGFIQWQ